MPDTDVSPTLRSCLASLATHSDLARTMQKNPRATIQPPRPQETGPALEALIAALSARPGRIAIERTIGEGGMGVVHLATQESLGRHVAVKTFRPGTDDPLSTLKLLREAWVTGALEHPNIVPVHDIAIDAEGRPLVVMKRIEGVEWGVLMHAPAELQQRFGAKDAIEWNLRVFAQVCNAVHFAHSRGILHRDLKPENVMIGAFGEVYVVDWGLAVSVGPDPSARFPPASEAREIAGTPCYMAPEMMLADPSRLSARTDVYLLGAILFEIFAARPPHEGDSLEAIVASVLVSEPTFPARFPHEAAQLCRRALARDAEARFASADVLRLAIEEYLQHRDSRRLSWEARQSLDRLVEVLETTEAGESRTLEAYRLLGECRFGYRAALSAWKANEAAHRGLDRALSLVIEHELAEGDPNAADALLREMSEPPSALAARTTAAVQARAAEEERLQKLGSDLDARIGTRTRSFVGGGLGLIWTATPLLGWSWERGGGVLTHEIMIASSAAILVFASAVWLWARDSLTRTLLNRRLTMTVAFNLLAQIVVSVAGLIAGITAARCMHLWVFIWFMTTGLVAVWGEPWFAVAALVNLACFLVGAAWPEALRPAMSFANFVLTVLVVWIWFPRQDIARIRARRQELQRRTRRLFLRGAGSWNADEDEPSE